MGNYKRNVTYFYQYRIGCIGSTSGFLKMEVKGEIVRIIINIQEPMGIHRSNPVLYFYYETPDNLTAVKICDVERCGEVLTLQTKTGWEKMFDTGRDLYSFDGVLVYYNKNDYYLGDFKDRDRSSYELVLKEEAEKPSDNPEINSTENVQDTQSVKGDHFDDMIKEFPKLPMGGAQELFDCVRINLKDIGKLDISNWKLGANSFLTHGFYTYQYLMLGKLRFDDGKKQAVIGVPGVYSNREKYLANMFGFEQFIPVKKTGIRTGQFGYWIVELAMPGDRY